MMHILFLHGFLSSPTSKKSLDMAAYLDERDLLGSFHAPVLPVEPQAALFAAESALMEFIDEPFLLVGSSLGGYYATHLAEKWNAPAVLINPAVRPFETLKQHVGWQIHHSTGERVFVRPEYFAQLEKMYVPNLSLDRYWLLASRDDAVLDCQQAEARYAGAKQTVLDTGGHTFEAFADYLEAIYEFGTAWTGQAA